MNQTDHQNQPVDKETGGTAKREKPLQEHAHWRCDCVPDLGPAHCHRCSRVAEAHASKEPPAPWRMTNLAREQAASFDLTPREAVEMAEAATVKHRTLRGGVNHYCDDLLILVDEDGECIISIVKRDEVLYENSQGPRKPHGSQSTQRGKSGGPGRRMPSTTKEMLALLKEHGFAYEMGGTGHYLITHPDYDGPKISIPATPSDKRSLQNCVSQIKRRTGIDVTLRADGRN